MAVDPTEPEKGIFTATFSIPSSCSCSIDDNHSGSIIIDNHSGSIIIDNHSGSIITTTTTKKPVIGIILHSGFIDDFR